MFELPLAFVAIKVAKTLWPQAKLNGAPVKADRGIVHLLNDIIESDEPSQLVNYVEYVELSLYLK